jgi:hypothetical protein
MGRPLPSFSQLIEQERRRWAPFRRVLSQPDQEAFDHLFACIMRHLQADVYLSRPRTFEAVIPAVLLEHEGRIRELLSRLGAYEGRVGQIVEASGRFPEWMSPGMTGSDKRTPQARRPGAWVSWIPLPEGHVATRCKHDRNSQL